jgi:hypothetical protein
VIGVVSKQNETRWVQEFFELFKTPWEFYVPNRRYDLVLTTSAAMPVGLNTAAVVVYASHAVEWDREFGIEIVSRKKSDWLQWDGSEFPVYGEVAAIQWTGAASFLTRRSCADAAGASIRNPAGRLIRVGYDLFREAGLLLSEGQPPENSCVPTLEMHIALLRGILASAGLSFVEVPPTPAGFEFMACLSHDVDFTGIREHRFDHTMWGFLYRASIGSIIDVFAGKIPWSTCLQNWQALIKLPFVHLGLQDDFWLEYDRYMEIEKGLGSTFFFIPFKDYPGNSDTGPAPKRRAAKYDVRDIRSDIDKLIKNGCEIGLHGVDAWRGPDEGRAELSRIREVSGRGALGVRMHWLYFADRSPRALDEAGCSYDSTFGYNDAVGYRAGTAQAFAPLGTTHLLELPLGIQDTALFYPGRMNLTDAQARDLCHQVIGTTARFGGVLTINWHTRSLSPERLWGDFYAWLIGQMKERRAWFANASTLISWFRERRAIQFEEVQGAGGRAWNVTGSGRDAGQPFVLRIYSPLHQESTESGTVSAPAHRDIVWQGQIQFPMTPSTTPVEAAHAHE